MERKLAEAFWPGPLTMVIDNGQRSEGFRIPDNPVACEIAGRLGGLLRATSANLAGDPPALTAREVFAALGDSVDLIVEADRMIVRDGCASSVVKVNKNGEIEVLREGALSREQLIAAGRI